MSENLRRHPTQRDQDREMEAWATLRATRSRPTDRAPSGLAATRIDQAQGERHNRWWTPAELSTLLKMHREGFSRRAIANETGRTIPAVKAQIERAVGKRVEWPIR